MSNDYPTDHTDLIHRLNNDTLDDISDTAREAAKALEAMRWHKGCPGIPRDGCSYTSTCDQVCTKCGKVHSSHQLTAKVPCVSMPKEFERQHILSLERELQASEARYRLLIDAISKGLALQVPVRLIQGPIQNG